MLVEGQELRVIIGRTSSEIELRNEYGRCCRTLSSTEALVLDLDLIVGIGTGAAFGFCAGVRGFSHSMLEAIRRND